MRPRAILLPTTSVIAVTAVDKNLRSYIQATHGDYIDLAAPGVENMDGAARCP